MRGAMPVRMGVAVAGDGARLCLVHVYSVRFSVVGGTPSGR